MMIEPTKQKDALIDLIYEASTDPRAWQDFNHAFRKAMGGVLSGINFLQDQDDTSRRRHELRDFESWVNMDRINEAYFTRFWRYDPFHPAHLQKEGVGFLNWNKNDSTNYYTNFMAAEGLGPSLNFHFVAANGSPCWVTVARDYDADGFDADDRELCEALIPHMKRSTSIYTKLQNERTETLVNRRIIDTLSIGVIVLDLKKRVLFANATAQELALRRFPIDIKDNVLRLGQRRLQETIDDYLDELTGYSDIDLAMPPKVLCLPSDLHGNLVAVVRPASGPLGRSNLVIYLQNLARNAKPSADLLAQLFGLTPRESEISLLISSGFSLQEIASKLSLSERTVRNHTQSVFFKTDTNRQAELVRLLSNNIALAQ